MGVKGGGKGGNFIGNAMMGWEEIEETLEAQWKDELNTFKEPTKTMEYCETQYFMNLNKNT